MRNSSGKNRWLATSWSILGAGFFIIIWALLKSVFHVPDRVLPSIKDVLGAASDIEPGIGYHILSTLGRLLAGFVMGVCFGLFLGIFIYSFPAANKLLAPTIQSFRAVPPMATVPFFILWFGFSDVGRFCMIIVGIGFNIAIACYQILNFVPDKYQVLFRSFNTRPSNMLWTYMVPRIGEELLPTIRFSLSVTIGLVIVSELLGAQIGLGYLIQTARSTYSLHVIFLCMIVLGLMNFIIDTVITLLWKKATFWKK